MKYIKEVEAVQILPNASVSSILSIVPDVTIEFFDKSINRIQFNEAIVKMSDWIVKDQDKVYILSDEDFRSEWTERV